MYTVKERKIYKFNNGEKVISRDPRRIQRRLAEKYPKPIEVWWESLKSEDSKLFNPAMNQAVEIITYAFEVKSLDEEGNGFTEDELLELFFDFLAFNAKKKEGENVSENTTSSPEPTPNPESSNTLTTTDCGCVGQAS